jgi:D-lactate dehydrogenase
MTEIKRLFDPEGLLNPGVILNQDPDAHLKHLKPVPATEPLVDKCMECGLCESKCPSHGLTLSPRQRIVGWREIARLDATGEPQGEVLREQYDYMGIDTCAACGLCESACPVRIDTGALIKTLRSRRASATAKRVGGTFARQYRVVTAGVRWALSAADVLHGVAGTRTTQAMLDGARTLSGGSLLQWSPTLPRSVNFRPKRTAPVPGADRIVYFPSCAARNMGAQRGDDPNVALPEVAERLFRKAGYAVVYPSRLGNLCCGQPFESKGLMDAADFNAGELEAALREVSDDGRMPIVFDTSPCAYRMKRYLESRLTILDSIEFVHDRVLPRVRLVPSAQTVAIHPVCSVRKMGTVEKLVALAQGCSREPVATVDDVMCCGFAGDQGLSVPELNEHALRHLNSSLPSTCSSGYSTSRTCEIGLSQRAGFPYKSILYLVDACAVASGKGQTNNS